MNTSLSVFKSLQQFLPFFLKSVAKKSSKAKEEFFPQHLKLFFPSPLVVHSVYKNVLSRVVFSSIFSRETLHPSCITVCFQQ